MKDLPFAFSPRWAEVGPLLQEAVRSGDEGTWRDLIGQLEERDRQLEDFLSRQPVIYNRDASVEIFRSKPWTAKDFGRIRHWNVELGQDDDGTDQIQAGDVVVELHVNGTMERTLTLPAGGTYVEYDGELPTVGPGDRVTVYTEDIGFDLVSTVSF